MIGFNFYLPHTARPCGVESFATHLESGLPKGDDCLVLNFPLVSWKKVFFAPIFALLKATFFGKRKLIILHEWKDLDWKRRWFIAPNLFFATDLLFSSPYVRECFENSPIVKLITKNRACVPIPPSLKRELPLIATAQGDEVCAIKAQGKYLIGHFGSIYARKQSLVLLDIAAQLKAKGEDIFVVFLGSFVKSGDNVEGLFNEKVAALDLKNDVYVSGFLKDDNALFDMAQHIDCFIYPFDEGLSSRRSSVIAVAQSGKPLITPVALRKDEFDHHALYMQLIANNIIHFVPYGSDVKAYVEAILTVKNQPVPQLNIDFNQGWLDATHATVELVAH